MVGPETGVGVVATVIKNGNTEVDRTTGEVTQDPDQTIFDHQPVTFSSADRTFQLSIDLRTYGSGYYRVQFDGGDGVDTISSS